MMHFVNLGNGGRQSHMLIAVRATDKTAAVHLLACQLHTAEGRIWTWNAGRVSLVNPRCGCGVRQMRLCIPCQQAWIKTNDQVHNTSKACTKTHIKEGSNNVLEHESAMKLPG